VYRGILARERIEPAGFLMVGNSLKSDILPVLALGAAAVYVPYHLTWAAERVAEPPVTHPRYAHIGSLRELPDAIERLG